MTRPALAALVAASAALAAPVPKELKDRRPDNFCPMTVGDKREYAHPARPEAVVQTREITSVEEKNGVRHYTQTQSTGQVVVMKVEKAGVFIVSSGGTAYDPPYKACGPDMKAGDVWDCGGANGMRRSVGPPEKITVPAGTFTAYPVTTTYAKVPGATGGTIWYADGVGMVRYDSGSTTTLVLVKYTPGKESK